mmetsp:Transcript_50464/g.83982  ORF Transcript_50464/g.83982 Transcript_50464/m.83982 type:complete len:200 (-) Transcript_50464:1365-1964(-)
MIASRMTIGARVTHCHMCIASLSKQFYSTSANQPQSRKKKYPKYADPNYPKRPMNGYLLFWSKFRPDLMAKNDGLSLIQTAKIAGKEWHNMGDIQRDEWRRNAEAKWRQYRQSLVQYKSSGGLEKWQEQKQTLPQKLYPRSPIAVYMREQWKPESSMKQLAQQWEQESDDAKDKYKAMWRQEKQTFLDKYGKYLKTQQK